MNILTVDEISRLAQKHLNLLGRLRQLIERELESLQANDADALSALMLEKESLLRSVALIEAEGSRIRFGLTPDLKERGMKSWTVLLAEIPADRRGSLEDYRVEILKISEEIQILNQRSSTLYEQGRRYLRLVLDALGFPEGRITLYGPGASLVEMGESNFYQGRC